MKFAASLLCVVGIAEANFRSGSVSTFEKFQYGKFVTRMKAPDRKGTVSSFFTYFDGPNFTPEGWNEFDFEIVPSVAENPVSMNIIYGDGHNKVESQDYVNRFNPHDDWHTYEMEWTPRYVSWSVDGHEIRHLTLHGDPAVSHLHKAQSLRMNFWTPDFHAWGEGFNPVDMPWYVLYDYVEVFKYDADHNQFVFHWRDDFDSFDSSKWHKASGGFESNTSVFHPANAYTTGGNLVLKMEPERTTQEELLIKERLRDHFSLDFNHRHIDGKQSKHYHGPKEAAKNSDSDWSDVSDYEEEEERPRRHEYHDFYPYGGDLGTFPIDHQVSYDHYDVGPRYHDYGYEQHYYDAPLVHETKHYYDGRPTITYHRQPVVAHESEIELARRYR